MPPFVYRYPQRGDERENHEDGRAAEVLGITRFEIPFGRDQVDNGLDRRIDKFHCEENGTQNCKYKTKFTAHRHENERAVMHDEKCTILPKCHRCQKYIANAAQRVLRCTKQMSEPRWWRCGFSHGLSFARRNIMMRSGYCALNSGDVQTTNGMFQRDAHASVPLT